MQAAAAADEQIMVTGEVPDVRHYLAAGSIMAVPLFQGGGTRLKILEAFAAGCPVVSTSKGAEGLIGQTGKHLMVVETADQMVQTIHQLWADPEQAHRLALAARHLVQAEYSWEAILPRVKQAVEQISLETVHE
jgi:glycosyltransferase involved in cell wall biosynthesis